MPFCIGLLWRQLKPKELASGRCSSPKGAEVVQMRHVSAKWHAARCEGRTVTLVAGDTVRRVAMAAGVPQGCPREADVCLGFPAEGKRSVTLAERFELRALEVLGKSLFSAGKPH